MFYDVYLFDRKGDLEMRPFPYAAVHLNRAVMGIDDIFTIARPSPVPAAVPRTRALSAL